MRFNNVELDRVLKTLDEFKSSPEKAVKTISVEGAWLLEDQPIQFVATAKTEGGVFKIEADSPGFLGGSGSRPGPMHYCLTGISSCFMSTLIGVACEKGIRLKKAEVRASCEVDFRKPLGLADTPPLKAINLELVLEADTPREKLVELVAEAEERCPAIYSLKTPQTPSISLK